MTASLSKKAIGESALIALAVGLFKVGRIEGAIR
jgi:hypothetical protein